jgi:hypothetical protein
MISQPGGWPHNKSPIFSQKITILTCMHVAHARPIAALRGMEADHGRAYPSG